jgi:hypothetical protein
MLSCPTAFAMTYAPIADGVLADQSAVIVIGEVRSAGPDASTPLDATSYRLRIDAVVKGELDVAEITVRQPGAHDPAVDGALSVPGAAKLQVAERALLFLNPRPDGAYEVAQMSLGAFHVRTSTSGETLLVRDLSDAEVWEDGLLAKEAPVEVHRRADAFAQWLRARTHGIDHPADYWSTASPVGAKFNLYGTTAPRWFEFDNGGTVTLHAGNRGQEGLSSGGYTEFQAAIRAFNRDEGSNVRFLYGGTTAANGGLARADGVNAILFNDPNHDIPGSYSCLGGGVIAVTVWRSQGTRELGGRAFKSIVETDTVVQDGAGCLLQKHANAEAAEVFAHELGHALGLAHSCGDNGLIACTLNALLNDALMRPTVHGDGRGASLRSDDLAGIKHLYPNLGASPGTPSSGNGTDSDTGASSGGGALSLSSLLLLLLALPPAARRATAACRPSGSRRA